MGPFQKLKDLEKIMMAVTFAEANEHEVALRLMEKPRRQKNRRQSRKAPAIRADNRPQLRM